MPRSHPTVIAKLRQLWRLVRESHTAPLTGQPRKPLCAAPGETAITFIGHSSFLIQTGNRSLLIDPVFATRLILMRRQRRPGVLIRDLPRIDAVLLTHAHMDHLNLPSLRKVCGEMRRRNLPAPMAIIPRGVRDLIANIGFSAIHELDWWQTTTAVPGVDITATPAKHWGARLFKDTHRGFGGYVLRAANGPALYHSGDTAYFNGFHEIGQRLQPEIALLPIGAYFPDSYRAVHTSPEEALQAFRDLGARIMVPMHFGTFRLGREPIDEPLPRLVQAARSAGLEASIHPLEEGDTWLLPRLAERTATQALAS